MMSDQEVAVKISADVKSLLQGMKDAQKHTETAVAGMKGDLGSLIESFEKMGPAALALGAVGLAFEALKEGAAMTMEAVHATDELSRSFETLHMRTGASYEDITVYKNAMVLSGGSLDDFSGLLTGLSRKMAANSDIYIANGIAASKADLDHQDLMTTLAKSVQVLAAVEDPGRRAELAVALLGGRAQTMIPQIMRMNEVIEKEGVEGLKKYGATIDNEAVEKMKMLEHETGAVKLEIEKVDQVMADSGRSWATWGAQASLAWHKVVTIAGISEGLLIDGWKAAFSLLSIEPIVEVNPKFVSGSSRAEREGKSGPAESKEEGSNGVTQKELEAKKKAAEDSLTIARSSVEAELKATIDGIQQQIKADNNLVQIKAMDADVAVDNARDAAIAEYVAQDEAYAKKLKLAQGNNVLISTLDNERAANYQKMNDTLAGLDQKQAVDHFKAEEKSAKDSLQIAKIEADGAVAINRLVVAEQDKALDEGLAAGRISSAQWVALKRDAAFQAERIDLDALNREEAAANGDLVKIAQIEQKKLMLIQKTANDTTNIEQAALLKTENTYKQFIDGMTQGWDSAMQKMIHGQMTWQQGFIGAARQIEDQTEKFFINMGLQYIKDAALKEAMALKAHFAQNQVAAKDAAANAYASAAEIPFVGWIIAPAAAAAAYTATIAFAEGGWDRVPSDQVAMIHKNEMVLPAHIANPLRESLAGGGGLGGQQHIHIHAMDSQSFTQALKNNTGGLMEVLGGVMRNGRRS